MTENFRYYEAAKTGYTMFPEMPNVPKEHDKYIPETFTAIGNRNIRRLDGYEKASGLGKFTRDINLPGMLFAKYLYAPHGHAKIKKMDTSKAEVLPGVRYVLRYDDPEVSNVKLSNDYLLSDTSYYNTQPIGAIVVADTEDIADEGLRLIDVEWEKFGVVIDHEEGLKPGAPIARPDRNPDSNVDKSTRTRMIEFNFKDGDIETGFSEADRVIEFTGYVREGEHLHCSAEPMSCICQWLGDNENLEIWVHHQHPYGSKQKLSSWLGVPLNKIKVTAPYSGGMYGGWNENCVYGAPLWIATAILAKRSERPVKLLWGRRGEFISGGHDSCNMNFKVGFKNDGTITAVKAECIGHDYVRDGWEHFFENARVPHIHWKNTGVMENKPHIWSYRCEQRVNSIAINVVMGHVAAALGIDPIEVALKNDGCEGRDMSYLSQFKIQHGFPDRDSLKECIDAGKAAIDWDNKWHHPGEKMLPNGKMHGISMVWTHDWDSTRGVGMAGVLIHHDGSVDIISQKADIGVNHDTTYTQIVADELGMRYEDVNFRSFNDVGFQLMTADGSCNLCSNGYVVRKAAKRCKQRLLEAAITPCLRETAQFSEISWEEYPAAFPGMKPEDLDVKDSYVFEKANPENRVTVADVVQRTPQTSSAYQEPVYAYAWHRQGRFGSEVGVHRLLRQAHFMEVEVDTETGEVNITNVVNVNDVGKAVSPETVEGQMYGGMYMAVGGSRSERMIYDPSTAVLLNGDLEGYKWSTIEDIGNIETIIVETSLGYGPYGAGGVGENVSDHPVTLLGLALHNAIDKWVDSYPITPDKVLKALGKI